MQNLKLLKPKQTIFDKIPKLLTKKEAIVLLKISKPTIDRYAASGKLKKIKFAGKVYFAEEDIKNLINKGYNG